jgi:hypothetical protein
MADEVFNFNCYTPFYTIRTTKITNMVTIKQEFLKLEKSAEAELTVLWHELEDWQQDNHYIHSGYRPASNSYRKSAKRYV